MILDDMFSALDHGTEVNIADRLFSAQGLLSKIHCSTILVTHSLRHASMADRVILVDPEKKDAKIYTSTEFSKLRITGLEPAVSKGAESSSEGEDTSKPKDETGAARKPDSAVKVASQEDGEDLARRTGDAAAYHYYYRAIGLARTLAACFILAIFTFTSNFPRYWIQWYTDNSVSRYAVFIGVYVMFVVVATLSQGAMIW